MRQADMPMSAAERGEIDLVQLLREVGRRKWLVLGAGVAALVLSTVGVNTLKPRFTAETRVFLENRETAYTSIGRDGQRGQEPLIDQDAVLSQEQLIQSRDIARAMIRKFDLTAKPEFDPVLNGVGLVTRVGVMLGLFENPARLSPEERVMDVYFERLKVFGLKKSRVIAVEFQSRDPELAAKLSLGIAQEYIRQLEQAKRGAALSAGSWLGRTVEEARQRVAIAEAKVEAFRTQNGLFQVDSDKTNLSSQQLSELNTQLATARAQQSELSSRARIIREAVRQGRIFDVSEIVNNELVRRLIENRATLRAQIAQEERTLLPQHPRIRELYAQLAGLEDQIRAAADRTARTLDNDARAAGARVAASQAELDLQKRQSGVANEAEVQLRALEREAKAEREQLENFLARYRDASVRETDNAVTADARIVSQPLVPGLPSFPKKLPIIIIATLAAVMLSLFYVLMRALLSDAVYVRRAHPAPYDPAIMAFRPESAQPVVADQQVATATSIAMENRATGPAMVEAKPIEQPLPPQHPTVELPPSTAGSAAMREALGQMGAAISQSRAATERATAKGPAAAQPFMSTPRQAVPLVDAPPLDGDPTYDPLYEVADEAALALLRGQPVTILFLGVAGGELTQGPLKALNIILSERGSTIALSIDPTSVTPAGMEAAAASLADTHAFVLIDGGHAGANAQRLSRAATLTVLVASDDLEDDRVDAAARGLAGCSYFIINTVPAPGMAGVRI